jgi:hypothetical protein
VHKSRRWLYGNLILLAGFAIIGSLARPTLAAPGDTALVLYCERNGCLPPTYTNCSGCFAPGAPCSEPPLGCCNCTPKPRPVGCSCE